MLESHDAVADLALAEGVYQAVVGNYDRVASTYDAYARGTSRPSPTSCERRTGASASPTAWRCTSSRALAAPPRRLPASAMTPRAQAEPSVNKWLSTVLPPPDQDRLYRHVSRRGDRCDGDA